MIRSTVSAGYIYSHHLHIAGGKFLCAGLVTVFAQLTCNGITLTLYCIWGNEPKTLNRSADYLLSSLFIIQIIYFHVCVTLDKVLVLLFLLNTLLSSAIIRIWELTSGFIRSLKSPWILRVLEFIVKVILFYSPDDAAFYTVNWNCYNVV